MNLELQLTFFNGKNFLYELAFKFKVSVLVM